MGAKIIVVACNTATTNAISRLRSSYHVPFIGIEPAIKPAALHSQAKCIGILATKGTLSSTLFSKTSDLYSKDNKIIEVVGKGLVEQIEKGQKDSPFLKTMLEELLRPMLAAGIDHLVLGCSHYPYLIPTLKQILPPHVQIIDSGMAVAKQTKVVLQSLDLLTTEQQHIPQFYTNGDPDVLKKIIPAPSSSFVVEQHEF